MIQIKKSILAMSKTIWMDPNHFGPKEGQGIRPHIKRNYFLYDFLLNLKQV